MPRFRGLRAVTLTALTLCGAARADPGYYVVTAYDDAGVRSVDLRYWTVQLRGSPTVEWPELGLGWGVNSRWFTEVYASYIGSSQSATRLNTLNWQNEVLLTQGQYPFDLAIHGTVTRLQGDENASLVEIGPVFQTDVGRTQLNANVFFEHGYGDEAGPTRLKYQWQVRHRWMRVLHLGLQGFGELGPWNHWLPSSQQSHRAGPALFGTLDVGQGQVLLYQASYLMGSVYGQRGNMLSVRVQWRF